MSMQSVPIDWVKIGDSRRAIDEKTVEVLMNSIRENGLLQAIGARADGTLIWGAHRLTACQRLGHEEIACNVLDVDGLRARMAEIDENLASLPLTAVEQSIALVERKRIYEELHPETKRGASAADQQRGADGKLGNRNPQSEDYGARALSFVEQTAAQIKKSPKSIERALRIGRAFNETELQQLTEANVPVLMIDKLARLRNAGLMHEEIAAILVAPAERRRGLAEPLMESKDPNRAWGSRRERTKADQLRREASLERQTPEQRRARLEAGELLEADRIVERINRLTFSSALEQVREAVCSRMSSMDWENNDNASVV